MKGKTYIANFGKTLEKVVKENDRNIKVIVTSENGSVDRSFENLCKEKLFKRLVTNKIWMEVIYVDRTARVTLEVTTEEVFKNIAQLLLPKAIALRIVAMNYETPLTWVIISSDLERKSNSLLPRYYDLLQFLIRGNQTERIFKTTIVSKKCRNDEFLEEVKKCLTGAIISSGELFYDVVFEYIRAGGSRSVETKRFYEMKGTEVMGKITPYFKYYLSAVRVSVTSAKKKKRLEFLIVTE